MKKIGFLGCGNIATAIAAGAVKSGSVSAENVYCFDILEEKRKIFGEQGYKVVGNENELASSVDVLFLTVKPQIFDVALPKFKNSVSEKTLIVSPAAGIKIEKIETLLERKGRIIRLMPNTPLLYQEGATAIVRGENVSDDEFIFVKNIFSLCGIAVEVPENQIDIVTGISGSSPAFFFRFAREIIAEGVKMGMDEEVAKALVVQTMKGSAKMLSDSPNTADELIKAVASPNGTTEAGLKTMDALSFDEITQKVTRAAIERSVELSK